MATAPEQLYAGVLLDLAVEAKQVDAMAAEVASLDALFTATPGLPRFLANPVQSAEAKERLVAEAVEGLSLSDLMRRFLGVVLRNRRLQLFPEIADAFRDAHDAQRGVERVSVASARPLDRDQVATVATRLGSRLEKAVEVEVKVAPDLIGGLVVQVGSEEIDGSVRGRLKGLRAHLLAE
jgi:F-type H+-transporting ATPase subunit delta